MATFTPAGPTRFQHQRKGLRDMIQNKGVHALLFDPGLGKGLRLDTEVPTPSGWTTMGDLRTGDKVIDAYGKPTTVIAHDPYEARCWRLTFSDGTQVVCDEDHLWVTEDRRARRRAQYQSKVGRVLQRDHKKPQFEVRDTVTIVKTLFRDSDGGANHRVEMAGAFRPDAMEPVLPLDPYLLGYWLGDGTSAAPRISVGQEDVEWVKAQLPMFSSQSVDKRTGVVTLGMGRGSFDQLGKVLRDMGLYGNKHVPQTYLRSAASRRLDLLRGLMDSDGTVSKDDGHVEFCSTRQELAEGVRELACSLGERAVIKESDAALNGEIKGRRWRVTWTPEQFDPFRMPRKSTEPRRLRDSGRYITSAEDMGVQTVRCLTVDSPTAQYLITRSWVPTHNTAVVLDYASLLALKSPTGHAKVLVLAPLAALDSWVNQAPTFVGNGIDLHAEALGGGLMQRAETLRARGAGDYIKNISKAHATARKGSEPLARLALGIPGLTILAVNFDSFSSRRQVGSRTMADVMTEAVKAFGPDLLVADESHRLKSPGSNTSRAVARVARTVKRRVILTGTVMPHSPMDVFGQWKFLEPTAFGALQPDGTRRDATFGSFRSQYAKMGGWMGKEIVGFKNLNRMQQIMAQNATTATKDEALDLPPVTDVQVPIDLDRNESRAYQQMVDDLVVKLTGDEAASVPNRLAQLMRLRQITGGFLKADDGSVVDVGQTKVKTVESIVNDTLAGEKRVVVFAHFRHEIDRLMSALQAGASKDTEVVKIDGGTPNGERIKIRQRFGDRSIDDRIILVAQTRTMSLAVNELVTASHAVFASLPERRDDITQARARLDRQGQTRPVTIWTVLAPRTVDEVLLKSYHDRTDLEAAMLDHIKAVAE